MSGTVHDGLILSDRYVLERELDRGAMGVVYLAHDRKLDTVVAVKIFDGDRSAAADPERFLAEVRTAARLNHPHILQIFDSGDHDGMLFYVMPRVEGESLRDRLDRDGPLPVDAAIDLATQVASGLAYAHAHGVIHRDIKPGNVLIDRSGHASVADFGLARALSEVTSPRRTGQGTALGSPAYMSPEQVEGSSELDGRADIYALGCMLYEMLAGAPPFDGLDSAATLRAQLVSDPPSLRSIRADVPPYLDRAVRTALSKDPDDRFETAEAFARALRPSTGSEPTSTDRRRRRGVVALVAAAAIVAGSLAAYPWLASVIGADHPIGVGVLPFDQVGGDSSLVYLAVTLTDEVSDALTHVERFWVPGRTSMYALKARSLSIPEIGERVGVDYLLEATVRGDAGNVSVQASLVDADSDTRRWQRDFDHVLGRAGVQEEIVRAVVEALLSEGDATALFAEGAPRVIAPMSADSVARDRWMRANDHWLSREPHRLMLALGELDLAIGRDSSFARAYATRANIYNTLGAADYGLMPPRPAYERAEAAARKALSLDPALAEAHAALAVKQFNYDWRLADAEEEFLEALRLGVENGMASHWYSGLLLAAGRVEEARQRVLAAQRMDPFSAVVRTSLARHHYYQGDFAAALAESDSAIALDPMYVQAHLLEGLSTQMLGDPRGALASYDRAAALLGTPTPVVIALRAHALGDAGRAEDARRLYAALRSASADAYIPAHFLALAAIGAGLDEEAVDWLETAYRDRSGAMLFLHMEPLVDPLRDHPRFRALIRTLEGDGVGAGAPRPTDVEPAIASVRGSSMAAGGS